MTKQHRPSRAPVQIPEQTLQEPELDLGVGTEGGELGFGGGMATGFAAAEPPEEPTPILNLAARQLGIGHSELSDWFGEEEEEELIGMGLATPGGISLAAGAGLEVGIEELVHMQQHALGTGGASHSSPNDAAEVEAALIANQIKEGLEPSAVVQRASARHMHNTPVTHNEIANIRALAQTHAQNIHSVIQEWTTDQTVQDAVHSFFGAMRRGGNRSGAYVDAARRILQEEYELVGHEPLGDALRGDIDDPQLATTLRWIRVLGVEGSTPAPAAPAPEEEAPNASGNTESPAVAGEPDPEAPGEITAAERASIRRTLNSHTEQAVLALRDELDDFNVVDQTVLGILHNYRRQVTETVRQGLPDDLRGELRQAMVRLRHRYGSVTGHSLASHIEAGLTFGDLDEALRLIGARATGPVVETAGAGVTPESAAQDARDRVVAKVDELHAAIEVMIAGSVQADLGDVDDAHRDAVNAARYQQGGRASGIDVPTAHNMVRDEYENTTGRSLAAHLGLAVRGSGTAQDELREQIRSQVGVSPAVASSGAADTEGGRATAEILRRHARAMAAEVSELRQANGPAARIDAGDIGDLWDAMRAEVRPILPDDWSRRFQSAYRAEAGVPLRASLIAACEGSEWLAEVLTDRLPFTVVVSQDRSRDSGQRGNAATALDLGLVLQEVRDLLGESYVNDQPVIAALRRARAAGRRQDPALDAAGVRNAYQARYHDPLENQLRARMGRENLNAALGLIGAAEDVTGDLLDNRDASVLDGDTERRLRELSDQYREIASTLNSASSGFLLNKAREFRTLHDQRDRSLHTPLPSVRDSRDLLVLHYASLHGDLLSHLIEFDATDEAFERLGWRSRGEAVGRQAESNEGVEIQTGESWNEQRFAQAASAQLRTLFTRIDTGTVQNPIIQVWDEIMGWEGSGELPQSRRRALIMERYQARFGISIADHVTRLWTRHARLSRGQEIASHLGFTLGAHVAATEVEVDNGDSSRALATQLAEAIGDRDLAAIADVMVGARGGDGRTRAEREAILEHYRRLRPNAPLDYAVYQAFGNDPGHLARARSLCSLSGRTSTRDHLLQLAGTGEIDRVTAVLTRLSDAERTAIRADGPVMSALDEHFDDEDYQRFRGILSGTWSGDDAIRENDRVWGLGFLGTDEDDINTDLTALARAQHSIIEVQVGRLPLNDAQKSRRVRILMREWGAAQSADPNMIELILDELEPNEIEHADMLLESGGSLNSIQRIIDDPSADTLIHQLEALSAPQRAQLLEDRDFTRRLRTENADNYTHALAILQGRGHLGALAGGAEAAWYDDTPEDTMMRNMAEMSVDEMRAYQNDRGVESGEGTVGRVRGMLDDTRDELQLHDAMSVDQRAIIHENDETAQARLRVIYLHKYRIIQGAYESEEAFLQAVLQFHNDRQDSADNHVHLDAEAVQEIHLAVRRALVSVSHTRITLTARAAFQNVVHGNADALRQMLRAGIIFADNPELITQTIEAAPAAYVASEWANIVKVDARGRQMRALVVTFLRVREHAGAQRALREFQLDAAEGVLTLLRDEHGVAETDERTMLNWRNALRSRIFALTGAQIATALEDSGVEGLTEDDHELLTGDERVARSRQVQSMDEREIMRDWSLADPFYGDEREASEAVGNQLGSEFSAASEDGELSEEEMASLADLRTELSDAITEYREARQATAEIAKIISSIIVTAVATALTGPGGPTLGAALLTSAIDVTLAEALDEACNGSENNFRGDLAKALITQALTTAITHQAGAHFRNAMAGFQSNGEFANRIAQFQAALAREPRLMQVGIEAMGRTAVNTGQSFASDILTRVGTNVMTDGLGQGLRESGGDIASELSDMPYDVVKNMLIQTVDRGVHHFSTPRINEIFTGRRAQGGDMSLGDQTLSLAARGSVPLLQEMRDTGASQLASAVTPGDQAEEFEIDEFGQRVVRRGMRRAGAALNRRVANPIRDSRRAAAVTEFQNSQEWRDIRSRLWCPADMDEEDFERLLTHTLQTEGFRTRGTNPIYPHHGRDTQRRLTARMRRVSTLWHRHPAIARDDMIAPDESDAFRTWVYSSPASVENKLRDSNWRASFDAWRGGESERAATAARQALQTPDTAE